MSYLPLLEYLERLTEILNKIDGIYGWIALNRIPGSYIINNVFGSVLEKLKPIHLPIYATPFIKLLALHTTYLAKKRFQCILSPC